MWHHQRQHPPSLSSACYAAGGRGRASCVARVLFLNFVSLLVADRGRCCG
ncbi:unnamed protein product [Ectocarpus sp. CCAP 1310/34]|nr:unnamed protein product [Ectocarpus sp. CCAP 1310/34]